VKHRILRKLKQEDYHNQQPVRPVPPLVMPHIHWQPVPLVPQRELLRIQRQPALRQREQHRNYLLVLLAEQQALEPEQELGSLEPLELVEHSLE
jgi:hypothetical protein